MTIKDYRYFFYYNEQDKGIKLYKNGEVKLVKKSGNTFDFDVHTARSTCNVRVIISSDGVIEYISCSCGQKHYGSGCEHNYAALLYIDSIYEDDISEESSEGIQSLIFSYQRRAVAQYNPVAQLEPEWMLDDGLSYRLKIGREKLYYVKDFSRFIMDFENNETREYGKFFKFTHSIKNLDETGRQLFQISKSVYYSSYADYSYRSARGYFNPRGSELEKLMFMYRDKGIVIDKTPFRFTEGTPGISLTLGRKENGRIILSFNKIPVFLGSYEHGFFMDTAENTIYITSADVTQKIAPFVQFVNSHENSDIYIAAAELTSFYNSVLKRVEPYANILYNDIPDDLIPPQMTAELYVDVDENNGVLARLKYCYAENSYYFPYTQKNNPYCDVVDEKLASDQVLKYFERNQTTMPKKYPFRIYDEDKILDLLSEGMRVLSKTMDIFVSDSFKKMKVRPAAMPNVGIRTSGNLLELDIEASGYTREELAELLQAYRKGKKYHRFTDGSFSLIDDGLSQLDMVTKELNINDKAFLKENIAVPMYRMLYLDSLQKDSDSIRIRRSTEFKRLVKSYQNLLTDESAAPVPAVLENTLRDYQKTGLQWFSTLGMYNMGGILADDMGLGKTLQTIAFMLSEKNKSEEKKQFLVVCPSSLVLNWQNEIIRFAPELSSLCMSGTANERAVLFTDIADRDVIITSYSTLLRDIAKYESMTFYAQFLDEAQNIKNHSTQSAKAVKAVSSKLRFALTGTPVENTLAELWSIFDFIMPGYLHNYSYFKKNYEQPIVKKHDEAAARSLQRLTSPFILRRLKKEVLEELPDKTETVLLTEMENEQKKIYTANAAEVRGELKHLSDSSDRLKILAMLTRLRQLCCDPSLVYENYGGGSAKLEQCIELIKSCIEAGHKILLFSQFTSMLDIIAARLDAEGVEYYMLTGKTKAKERLKLVNDFNENAVSVFLISLKAGGTGLNLTGADIVIHYDPWWNLSAENQASDRAYRIGQHNNVQVYKLITKNTIEERISELQQRKADLLETVLGGDGDIMKMSVSEVMSLLE